MKPPDKTVIPEDAIERIVIRLATELENPMAWMNTNLCDLRIRAVLREELVNIAAPSPATPEAEGDGDELPFMPSTDAAKPTEHMVDEALDGFNTMPATEGLRAQVEHAVERAMWACPVFAPPSKSVWALVDKWRRHADEKGLHYVLKHALLNHAIELDEALLASPPAAPMADWIHSLAWELVQDEYARAGVGCEKTMVNEEFNIPKDIADVEAIVRRFAPAAQEQNPVARFYVERAITWLWRGLQSEALVPNYRQYMVDAHVDLLEAEALLKAPIAAQGQEVAEMEARKDAAYLERNQVVAALASPIPASGFVMVPIEPTEAMLNAAEGDYISTGMAEIIYRDMLAVAPVAPKGEA